MKLLIFCGCAVLMLKLCCFNVFPVYVVVLYSCCCITILLVILFWLLLFFDLVFLLCCSVVCWCVDIVLLC